MIRVRRLPSLTIGSDEIRNFVDLRENVTEKLNLTNWLNAISHHSLYIFNLNKKSNGNLSIRNTISIDIELNVKVFGEINDDILFNWKLYRWTQLQTLIEQLSDELKREDDIDSECVMETLPVECVFKDNVVYSAEKDDATFEFCATDPDTTDPGHGAKPLIGFVDFIATSDSLSIVKSEPTPSMKTQRIPIESAFTCSECGKSFDQNARLRLHHRRVHQQHTCPECNEVVIGRFDKHMRMHFPKRFHRCRTCGEAFKTRPMLERHERIKHSAVEEFYCDICKTRTNFGSKRHIERHMILRHTVFMENVERNQEEYVRVQKERMRQQFGLNSDDEHEQSVNAISQSLNKCTICNKAFLTQSRHIKLHEENKLKSCPHCNKYFVGLANHIRTVHTRTDLICDICGSIFAGKTTLLTHLRVKHAPSENLSCDICRNGQVFRSRAYLKKHLAAHAKAALMKTNAVIAETVFECNENQCNEKFPSKYMLKTHIGLQHKETPLQCKVCNKIFGIKSALTIHEKLHTGNVDICHLCGQSFRHPRYLQKHLNRHANPPAKKPCTMCDKQYANGFDLRQHMKKIHDVLVIPERIQLKNKFK